MTAKKTQCPFCESIFAVTPEQLSARGGHVRCGKCFQVFKADERLVQPSPLGSNPAASSAVDIFDLLDQATPHDDESDTLAGQLAFAEPIAQPQPTTNTRPNDLGQLEQKADLDADFDALFADLTPQTIDPNESYAQSTQSKRAEFQPESTIAAEPTHIVIDQPAVGVADLVAAELTSEPIIPKLAGRNRPKKIAEIQDTPLPGSLAAVVLPALDNIEKTTSTSVFNKKQHTSAKLSALRLDDELSDLFLGDSGNPATKDILKHHDLAGVDKLSSTADESWADALLQEEEAAKKAAIEQQADKLLGTKKPPSVLKPSSAHLKAAPAQTAPARAAPVQPMFEPPVPRAAAIDDDDLLSYLNQVGATSEKTERSGTARHPAKNTAQPVPLPASHRVRVPVKTQASAGGQLVWGALCAVMLLLLLGQWLYFNFATLASDPQHNRQLTALCATFGCQVPSMDLSQISTTRIRLQRSPKDRSSTQVSLNMTNQADNSQLLPRVKFLQLNADQVVAYRLIEPHEYLQGNHRPLKQLLPRQSLKIQFDLNITRSALKQYRVELVY